MLSIEGCEYIRVAATELNNAFGGFYKNRMIGILDSDFFELDSIPETEPNLFRTDWHDHETWLIIKEGNISCILDTYLGNGYIANDFLNTVYDGLDNLSFIKWYHTRLKRTEQSKPLLQRKEGWNFGKSSMHDYFGKSIDEILDILKSRQDNIGKKIDLRALEIGMFKSEHSNAEKLHLHVGKDVINAIEFSIRKIKPRNIKQKEIYCKLRDKFSLDDFKNTDTYNNIKNYVSSIGFPDSVLF